jgi:hypothetical protein
MFEARLRMGYFEEVGPPIHRQSRVYQCSQVTLCPLALLREQLSLYLFEHIAV